MSGLGKVSVAILSWNGRAHLETCLAALRDQQDPGVEWDVRLLDNASRDGTAEWVRREHPWVSLVESPVNLGFCAGNNRLIEDSNADAVALLNNDTRPERGWLRELVATLAAAPSDVAAVSGLIVDWEGARLDFARGLMTFDGHALQRDFRRRLGSVQLPAEGAELLFACGGNMLVRRTAFRAAGGFDESYFAYYEDVDLGWRLWAGGERVVFAPRAVVRHRSAASSDLLGLFNRGFLFERNAFLTAYKNYEAGWWERMMPAVMLAFLSRTQSLIVENNPGGALLSLDPYAGHIADTATQARPAAAVAAPGESLGEKWRRFGPREFARRGTRKAMRLLRGEPAPVDRAWATPVLEDSRTQAQLRAVSFLLRHLDAAAAMRARTQARRRRSDAEIFRRFPLAVVPTYPGDEALFASPGFRQWLPADAPLEWLRLADVMDLSPATRS